MEIKRFIRLFQTHSEYEEYVNSKDFLTPNVSVCKDTDDVHFNEEIKEIDYSKQYFTLVNTSESSLSIQLKKNTSAQTLNYKLSSSEDWLENTAVTVGVGEEVQLKGVYTPIGYHGIGTFSVNGGTFDIKGNIMSLLYGDDFEGQIDLTSIRNLFSDCTTLVNASELILPTINLSNSCYRNMFENCTSLKTVPELPATMLTEYCYYSMFNGCTSLVTAPELPATTLASKCYQFMFSGCKSLVTAPELPATTLAEDCYSNMFQGCTSLTSALELLATTLTSSCYYYMFQGCTSLITAPELPATMLTEYCYSNMFNGCTSLTSAPELPATTLASSCYSNMFYGTNVLPDCSNIDFTSAEVVASGGLKGLFAGTKVTDADLERILPKSENGKYCLPCTTLADGCYGSMFYGCSSLVSAPELPATTLARDCYNSMFSGCKSLVNAPVLLATTLASNCYYSMFKGCTSLTTAPELPATRLDNYCYESMFYGCTSLTTAPALLATTLAMGCYSSMFSGCTSLTTAPELPATRLDNYCYRNMFNGCSNLSNITMLATYIGAYACLSGWVNGVASSGTFAKHPQMTSLPSGTSGIPNGWAVKDAYNLVVPFITNITSNDIVFYYSDGMFTPSSTIVKLYPYYSESELLSFQPQCDMLVKIIYKDDTIIVSTYLWETTKTLDDVINELGINSVLNIGINIMEIIIPENDGGYYYMAETKELPLDLPFFTIETIENGEITLNSLFSDGSPSYYSLNKDYWTTITESVTLSLTANDTIMLKGEGYAVSESIINTSTKFNVKGNIMSLLYADDFEGQTDLSGKDYAFDKLFYNCNTLINANELILPATILARYCYRYMFDGCTSLVSAPELPATTLVSYCYSNMFSYCTSLVSAPELPATTLASYCYSSMFRDCTSLVDAPELPATTLASYCYSNMFYGCSKLSSITMLATDISASSCLYYWVYNVASEGTFTKHPQMTSLPNGISGIPKGWTVKDY